MGHTCNASTREVGEEIWKFKVITGLGGGRTETERQRREERLDALG